VSLPEDKGTGELPLPPLPTILAPDVVDMVVIMSQYDANPAECF